MSDQLRSYPCRVRRVLDGDTFEVLVDLGFALASVQTVRIYGVQAPELRSHDGKICRDWANTWVGAPMGDWPLQLVTHSVKDKYGRRLGDLVKPTGATYANDVVNAGMATSWDRRNK